MAKTIPYAKATAGNRAREDTTKWLRRLGCEGIGFYDHFEDYELELAFRHHGQSFRLLASAKGYAQRLLQERPYNGRRRRSRHEYEQEALEQAHIAVSSVLRDWAKGVTTAIESRILSFEAVFMPYMITADGRTMFERISELKLLPAPEAPKTLGTAHREETSERPN